LHKPSGQNSDRFLAKTIPPLKLFFELRIRLDKFGEMVSHWFGAVLSLSQKNESKIYDRFPEKVAMLLKRIYSCFSF
jgi:hypothetical protein